MMSTSGIYQPRPCRFLYCSSPVQLMPVVSVSLHPLSLSKLQTAWRVFSTLRRRADDARDKVSQLHFHSSEDTLLEINPAADSVAPRVLLDNEQQHSSPHPHNSSTNSLAASVPSTSSPSSRPMTITHDPESKSSLPRRRSTRVGSVFVSHDNGPSTRSKLMQSSAIKELREFRRWRSFVKTPPAKTLMMSHSSIRRARRQLVSSSKPQQSSHQLSAVLACLNKLESSISQLDAKVNAVLASQSQVPPQTCSSAE